MAASGSLIAYRLYFDDNLPMEASEWGFTEGDALFDSPKGVISSSLPLAPVFVADSVLGGSVDRDDLPGFRMGCSRPGVTGGATFGFPPRGSVLGFESGKVGFGLCI